MSLLSRWETYWCSAKRSQEVVDRNAEGGAKKDKHVLSWGHRFFFRVGKPPNSWWTDSLSLDAWCQGKKALCWDEGLALSWFKVKFRAEGGSPEDNLVKDGSLVTMIAVHLRPSATRLKSWWNPFLWRRDESNGSKQVMYSFPIQKSIIMFTHTFWKVVKVLNHAVYI